MAAEQLSQPGHLRMTTVEPNSCLCCSEYHYFAREIACIADYQVSELLLSKQRHAIAARLSLNASN